MSMGRKLGDMRIKLVISNVRAVRALSRALEKARQLAEDMPWNDEAQAVVRNLEFAAKRLEGKPDDGG